jgi:hypothetical protein
MGIEYRLTLTGGIPLERLAEVAAPGAIKIPMPDGSQILSFDLYEERGYLVTIISGRNGYYDAEDDGDTYWEWEPSQYVNVSFDMAKNDATDQDVPNMVAAVASVLANSTEDAALVLNGAWLLLTRVDGKLRIHHRSQWWAHHGVENLIPW